MNNNELKKMANDMRKSAKVCETIGKWCFGIVLILSIILTLVIISLTTLCAVSPKDKQKMESINFSRGTGINYSDPDSRYDDGDILIGEENGYYIYEGKGGTYKVLK